MKRTFLFATIASILSINAYAVSATVTSKDYVDTQDALKQDIIGATLPFFPAGGVVETTEEEGVVTQRGICNAELDGDGDCDDDFLVTRDLLESTTELPETTVTYKTCVQYQNGDCILWNLSDKYVYVSRRCEYQSDCDWLDCSNNPNGTIEDCNNGVCVCLRSHVINPPGWVVFNYH